MRLLPAAGLKSLVLSAALRMLLANFLFLCKFSSCFTYKKKERFEPRNGNKLLRRGCRHAHVVHLQNCSKKRGGRV